MTLKATLDKSTYTPGETMTLTVTTAPGERDRFVDTPFTTHVSVEGVGEGEVSGVLRQPTDPAEVVVNDPDRVWAPVSDDTVTAVFTSKA